MISKPTLECKYPVGNGVSSPEYAGATEIISTKSADMKNSGTDLNQSASSENLSAKFKHPRVSQDIPSAGQGQYM